MKLSFTQEDLSNDLIVELNNGNRYLVLKDMDMMIQDDEFLKLCDYTYDLKHKQDTNFDVNKIYRVVEYGSFKNIFYDDYLELICW